MLERWAISLVIGFILRQLAKFQLSIDWSKVKADAEARIRDLVPGEWFDSEIVAVCMAVIDACAAVLASTVDIEKILKHIGNQEWQQAWEVLRDLIMRQWQPVTVPEKKVMAWVSANEKLAA